MSLILPRELREWLGPTSRHRRVRKEVTSVNLSLLVLGTWSLNPGPPYVISWKAQ